MATRSPFGRRPLLAGLGASAMLPRAAARAQQAGWAPDRPVTITVPFAAGGTSDLISRLIAPPMSRQFGQSVVVENVTGAGGTIGSARVARAAPDGHTVLIAHVGQLAVSQHLYRDLPYDPVQDFAPVGLICTNPMALLVSVRSGISGLEELRARAREGRLRIATSGTGTTLHLGALQFLSAVGGRADLIPYRGGGPATNDLIAGTVDMLIEQALSAIPTHQGGRARALVVTGPARLAEMPEVPTAAEAGLPGLDVEVWNGLVLPRGAPERVVAAHAAALEVALADETVRSRFARFSGRLPGEGERGPAHFARKIHAESERWGRLLREAGVERQG